MQRILRLLRTTVGVKAVVAVTGLILFGWVVMHMVGNLKVFLGTTAEGVHEMDVYAQFLRTMGAPLVPHGFVIWSVRIGLILAVALHIWGTFTLALRNRAARPEGYRKGLAHRSSTWAARTMVISGPLLLVYIVFHLLHITTGTVRWTPFEHGRVYENLHNSFQLWFLALIYVLAVAILAFHLYHGVWSLFQSLGINNPDRNGFLRTVALASAVLVFAGFASVPVALYLDLLPEPPEASVEAHHASE